MSACNSFGAALLVPSPTTTAPALRSSPTFIPVVTLTPKYLGVTPAAIRGAQWSGTMRGLTIGMTADPFPPQPATTTTYRVMLADAQGQPVSDATIAMSVVVGEATLEGEDDESLMFKLDHQGAGIYSIRTSIGSMAQVLSSISLSIGRGAESWDLFIPRSEMGRR